MPPRWMWALDEELSQHFERIQAKRKHGNDDDDDDDEPAGPMMRNEYAEHRGRNLK